jgi:hypothetical protein
VADVVSNEKYPDLMTATLGQQRAAGVQRVYATICGRITLLHIP